MRDYRLSDLLDMTIVQKLADANFHAGGLPICIIDAVDESILVHAGWQEVCTKFHRAFPLSAQRCRESACTVLNDFIRGRIQSLQMQKRALALCHPYRRFGKTSGNAVSVPVFL